MGSYGQGKNPIMLTKAQETLPMNLQKEILAKEAKESNSPIDMYGKKGSMAPMKGKMIGKKSPNPDFDTKGSMSTFKSDAQREAAYASGYKGKGK